MSKRVLITGATGNLGEEVVRQLHKEGYKIFATLGSGAAPDYFTELNIESRSVNLTDEQKVQEFAHSFLERHPDLEAIVMLVGGFAAADLEHTDGAAIDKMIGLNFKTAFFLTRPMLQYFEQRPSGGRFIFMGARPALVPSESKGLFAYALSKSLVFRLAESINEAGKGKNITATVVVPSTIDTPANREAIPGADFSKWITTSDLANTIAFVLSSTGQHLREGVLKMYNES